MEYTFKKSTCERYDIRWGRFGWAVIMIDEKGGVFSAQSDYGDYNYCWPKHGRESFKHFIIEISRDGSYFLRKVSKRDHVNFDESLKRWEKEILKYRKDANITREQAREAWDFIHDLDDYCGNAEMIQMHLYDSSLLLGIFGEPWEFFDTVMEYPPEARMFAKEVMPMLAEILKKEISGDVVPVPA